jgi:hypothetical protein
MISLERGKDKTQHLKSGFFYSAREWNSSLLMSTMIFSPSFTKIGTLIFWPLSRMAGFGLGNEPGK